MGVFQRDSSIRKWMREAAYKQFLVVNTAVFLVIQTVIIILNLSGNKQEAARNADLFLATNTDLSVLATRPWSVFTHMFTHVSFSHFLWNMVWLYFAGQLFESFYGRRKFAGVYIVGGIFGFLILWLATAVFVIPAGPAMGASAAIMAIFIAAAVHSPERQVLFFGVFPVRLKILAVIYVLADYMALRGEINVGGHIAHLAGAGFGLLFALQLKKGYNILKWFEKLTDQLSGLFKPRSVLRTAHKSVRHMTDEEYNMNKVRNEKQVDAILDKIARGGYDSLTRDEKDFLFKHSKRN